jgi:hypothetical protein
MDYDELVSDIVKQVRVRYEDYVQYRESEGFAVDSFDEVAEQLLADELNDSLIYYHQMWTIIEHNCDDVSSLFYDGAATFDGATPYDAFYSDCAKALDI